MSKKIPNINFIAKKRYAFTFSILLTLFSLITLFYKELNLSIDFKGGLMIEFWSNNNKDAEKILKNVLNNYEIEITQIYRGDYEHTNTQAYRGENTACCDYRLIIKNTDNVNLRDDVCNSMLAAISDLEFIMIDYIGPKISHEFVTNSIKAVVFSLMAMMAYVWFRFNYQFAIGILVTLLHDVILVLGFFSICNLQFDLNAITVLLTVIGYSINDSIVIYDRIRENMHLQQNICQIINRSINETLNRTIMTSVTTIVVCFILLIFGGSAIRHFSAALCFGISFGTYSSIFISAPILTYFSSLKC